MIGSDETEGSGEAVGLSGVKVPRRGGSRAYRVAVSEATEIPDRYLWLACATIFPNGEKRYADERVVELARELQRREDAGEQI